MRAGCSQISAHLAALKNSNVARAGILTVSNWKLEFESIIVLYDVDKAIADINRIAYPAYEKIRLIMIF